MRVTDFTVWSQESAQKVNVYCDCDAAGGRGGNTYGQSKALDDVWRFSVASRSWTQLTTSGRAPLPRFLFGYDIMYPMLHHSSAYKQAPQSGDDLDTDEQHAESSSNQSLHQSAVLSDLLDGVAPHAAELNAQHGDTGASMPVGNAFREADATYAETYRTTYTGTQPMEPRGVQEDGPAGSMIVFGGQSIQGCYLDDVWVLHLNSLMWQELSRPVACQKRCRSMLEEN